MAKPTVNEGEHFPGSEVQVAIIRTTYHGLLSLVHLGRNTLYLSIQVVQISFFSSFVGYGILICLASGRYP
jgi:hypothetical protein